MDSWMLTRLRLARARGSLQAPNSRVQDFALEILEMVDEKARETSRIDMVKGLIALGGPDRMDEISRLFPEYVRVDPFEQAYDETGEFDIDKVDPAAVVWEVPDETQDMDLSRWIEEQERAGGVTFTAEDDGWK